MKMKDFKPTSTDYAGNGYYKEKDGKYYYGNAQNGHLTLTEEERKKELAKSKQNFAANQDSGR